MKRNIAIVTTKAALEVMGTHYSLEGGMKIKDVIERWRGGDKVYDRSMPSLFALSEVWPHREYTWTRDEARSGYAIVDGKRVLLDGPLKWDAIAADMKKSGWRLTEQPCIVLIGRDGSSKVGEGNHRLAIAKEVGVKRIPVSFTFYTGKVTKNPQTGRSLEPEPKVTKKVLRKIKPTTPEEEARINEIMELLGM